MIRNAIQRFMYGRYGNDQLNLFLIGVYLLLYTGQGWASVSIKSGVLTETEYEFANYSWSVAEKTRYDEFAFPLVEGCTLSCETSKQDDFDCVWLIRLSDVD